MYDQAKQSELVRFARVELGATVIDVYPGDGDWTRLFSDAVGSEGRVYSFVPTEIVQVKNDAVQRAQGCCQSNANPSLHDAGRPLSVRIS